MVRPMNIYLVDRYLISISCALNISMKWKATTKQKLPHERKRQVSKAQNKAPEKQVNAACIHALLFSFSFLEGNAYSLLAAVTKNNLFVGRISH
jgi:hypothetical protein